MDSPMGSGGGGRRAMRPASARVAVLDTDSGFLQVLGKRLQAVGWEYRVMGGSVPPDQLVAMRLNAVLVDLAALGPSAWNYLERLCAELPNLGVVVCTGPSTVTQRVRGLRLGADDWISKPCHPEEVLARVEAVVRRRRRSEPTAQSVAVSAGELEIRSDQFQAFVGGVSADLTRREFELILLLAGAQGQVLEREEIYQRVWGYAMAHGDRSVDVFVRKLRLKLERVSPGWRYIHTHFGIGYSFAAHPVDGPEAGAPPALAGESARDGRPEAAPAPGRESAPPPGRETAPAAEPGAAVLAGTRN